MEIMHNSCQFVNTFLQFVISGHFSVKVGQEKTIFVIVGKKNDHL